MLNERAPDADRVCTGFVRIRIRPGPQSCGFVLVALTLTGNNRPTLFVNQITDTKAPEISLFRGSLEEGPVDCEPLLGPANVALGSKCDEQRPSSHRRHLPPTWEDPTLAISRRSEHS
jgi:hypothetical protein